MRPDPDQAPAEGQAAPAPHDRVEDVIDWVLAAVALLLIVVGTVIGLGTYGREAERSELQRTSTSQVRAVLRENANVTISEAGGRMPDRVQAR